MKCKGPIKYKGTSMVVLHGKLRGEIGRINIIVGGHDKLEPC